MVFLEETGNNLEAFLVFFFPYNFINESIISDWYHHSFKFENRVKL